ncbi:MAG: polyphosphate kinase 1 [Holophagales bacterium]|nr:MAG: polyphosphate kinase 1 [Holophagales bacterium]
MSPPSAPPRRSRRPPAGRPAGASRFANRELSWLDFNHRVLAEAADPENLLLERLKFLAIYESNLDEFVMKRVGGLQQQVASQVRKLSPDGMSPGRQLEEIRRASLPGLAASRRLLRDELLPALAREGVHVALDWDDVAAADRDWLESFFDRQLFPLLTPLGVDTAHPFPHISNLSLSLAVALRRPGESALRFARVKVPASLPRWTAIDGSTRFVALEAIIARHLDRLFAGMEIVEAYPFRVTRNVAVQPNEEAAADLLEAIQEELQERRFAPVVRLEVVPEMPDWMRRLLEDELEIDDRDRVEVEGPLALRDLFALAALPLPAHREAAWSPVTPPRLAAASRERGDADRAPGLFGEIARGDLLVHHPYDSFATSVLRFVEEAAVDPRVLAIKQTLYRTSRDSPVVKALVEAAERGKQVAVIVELKARFDEARNIEWAEALEEAGAHVAYGVVGYKTHAKVSLAVRQEDQGLRVYSHIATGNYNTDTAELYTDLGLFTCDEAIGADLVRLFNVLTGFVDRPEFGPLWVAPFNMRERSLALIAREIEHRRHGAGARIVAKMNQLEDPEIIEALYAASAAGVEVDLIVRGLCRLRAGVPGLSERIRVISILGRFLEHARIFAFANAGNPEYFLGSADWMSRNLDHRLESMVPVTAPELQVELQAILDLQLADNRKAWDLLPDGRYLQRRPAPGEPLRISQRELMARAVERNACPGPSSSPR